MTQTSTSQERELPYSRRASLLAVVTFWIAAGTLTGFLHGVELLVARHAFDQLAWFSREFAWMAPVAYTLVMAPGAIGLALLAVLVRRRWALALAAAAFVVVGVFGLLLPYPQVSRLASLILATGLGVVIARRVHAAPGAWIRASRIAALTSVIAVLGLIPGMRLWSSAREARMVRALPAAPVEAPNVLVIILDTMRAASMGLYGDIADNTPRLQEWSRSSAVFDWAFSPAPWTLPSHASMFTGAWAGEQSGDWERPLDRALPTLAERLRDRGYLTAAFVANMHYTAWDSGLPRGFARYEDYRVSWRQLLRSSSYTQTALYRQLRDADNVATALRAFLDPNLSIDPKHGNDPKRGDEVTDTFLAWRAANQDRPYFAFLNYFDAHQGYYAPAEFQRFEGERGLAMYRAAIAFLDAELDRLFTTLRDRGELDRTLVIVTSDHGELFGFKGFFGHAHNLYLNTIRVPLLIRFPGQVPGGVRVHQPVTLRDLAATVMDLAAPGAAPMPGTSLAVTWTGAGSPSPVLVEVTRAKNIESRYPTSRGNMQSLLDEQWQLIRNGDELLEFYRYRTDTALVDLATRDSLAGLRDAMRQRLDTLLRNRR